MNKQELSNALVDIRKSYRLLCQYQSRVKDLVKYSGSYFEFDYHGGWPWYSNSTPRNGRGKLENWSWDWLNMYLYDFHFKSKEIDGKEIVFSILLESDTGYYDSRIIGRRNIDKNDITSYEDAMNCRTRLIFKAGYGKWEMDKLFQKGEKSKNEMNLSRETEKWKLDNDDSYILAKAYDLAEFIDKEHTDNNLKDFESHCMRHQIILKEKNEI